MSVPDDGRDLPDEPLAVQPVRRGLSDEELAEERRRQQLALGRVIELSAHAEYLGRWLLGWLVTPWRQDVGRVLFLGKRISAMKELAAGLAELPNIPVASEAHAWFKDADNLTRQRDAWAHRAPVMQMTSEGFVNVRLPARRNQTTERVGEQLEALAEAFSALNRRGSGLVSDLQAVYILGAGDTSPADTI